MNDPRDLPTIRRWLGTLDALLGGFQTTFGCLFVAWFLIAIPGVILLFLLYVFGILE